MNQIDAYLEKYPTPTVKEYIISAIKECDVDFHSLIADAHQLTLGEAKTKKPHYMNKNWLATTMNGNIIGLLKDNYKSLMKQDKYKRDYLELASDIRVYFKKMDEEYKPNNVSTNHVKETWGQLLGGNEGIIHTLYVGYVLQNNDWTIINGVYASYPNNFYNRKLDWVLDMYEYTKRNNIPLHNNQTADEIIVTPKKGNQKSDIA